MHGIRGRLTVSFSIALLLTLGAFGAALYYELKQPSIRSLDERTDLEMKFALNWLQGSYRLVGPLVIAQDSMPPTLKAGISAAFESSRDYQRGVLETRLSASEWSLRAAQAALLHAGAKGYLAGAAAQRKLREAFFVAIVTPATKHLRSELASPG